MSPGRRATVYLALARLLDVGIGPATIRSVLGGAARGPSAARLVAEIADGLARGERLSEVLGRTANADVPRHHVAIVRAAETVGSVPRALTRLAEEDARGVRERRELRSRAAYPVLLIHMAIVAPQAGVLLQDPLRFLWSTLAVLVPVDVLLVLAWRTVRDPAAGRLARIRRPPSWVRDGFYGTYFAVLHALYEAGVPIDRAAREAAEALPPGRMRDAIEAAHAPLARNEPYALAVAVLPHLADEVRATLVLAEPAGELGRALADAARHHEEWESRGRARAVRVGGALLFTAAATYVAFRVVGFYAEYFAILDRL